MSKIYLSLFRDRLRFAMEKKGWNQTRLAEAIRLPASAVNHWIHGRRLPDYQNLRKLVVVLGCDANWLIVTGTVVKGWSEEGMK